MKEKQKVDLGEEIISRLKEIIEKLDYLIKIKL